MPRLTISPLALRDLDEIWLYIAKDNIDAAERVNDELNAATKDLAHYPRLGRERPEMGDGVRSYPSGNYLIIYLPLPGGGAHVFRIVHGNRDLGSLRL
jgi:toxin ParE1/3/4